MLKKLLTLNLVLILILQPVTVVLAGSKDVNDRVFSGHFSDVLMDCNQMDTMDCPGKEVCSTMGHTGCDVNSVRVLSVIDRMTLDISESMLTHRSEYLPLNEKAPPLRPPRIS